MRVLLISANTEAINMVTLPLGAALVAEAARRAGHEVELLDLLRAGSPAAAVQAAVSSFRPEAIGVSVRNIDDQNMAAPRFLLDQVRPVVASCRAATDAPVILGGAGYSIFPHVSLDYLGADMGLAGEGERVFPALLERLAQGRDLAGIPGLHLPGRGLQGRRSFARWLDDLSGRGALGWFPVPEDPGQVWVPVQSRRGCPLACAYCSTPAIEGRVIRKRSPLAVAEEVQAWLEAGFSRFYFTDNVFNLPPSQARSLCRELARLTPKPQWRCILHPAGLDHGLIEDLAAAGCVEASLGFESGSRRVLRGLRKRFSPDQVREVSARLAGQGIRHTGFLLLGGPGETAGSVEESLHFADSLQIDALKITLGIRIYPGTPLADLAREKGLISRSDDLLFPRFYLEPSLRPDRLAETIRRWQATRHTWLF